MHLTSVADPGFPRGRGANSPGSTNTRFCHFFKENFMKSKEFGCPPPPTPIKSPNGHCVTGPCFQNLHQSVMPQREFYDYFITNEVV